MQIDVDATQVARRIIHSHVSMPVSGSSAVVSYPLWNPGDHAPIQHVGQIASLTFHCGTTLLHWRRDAADMNTFHVELPPNATRLEADFDFLLPPPGEAFADSSQRLLIMRWNLYTLYVTGVPVSKIPVNASLTIPGGWKYATALASQESPGPAIHFQPTSLETLIDSPVLTGELMKRVRLSGGSVPVEMDVAAESPDDLPSAEAVLSKFGRLPEQARLLFGTEHFASYHFLVAASNYVTPGAGFEHQQSSDNREPSNYFHNPARAGAMDSLFAHEFVHSWNGKYRRPANLYTPDYQKPERTDLLWVYESLTEYLSYVLASRTGSVSDENAREYWAALAAKVEHETGRSWRPLQDTLDAVPLTMNEAFFDPPGWDSWLRTFDYYEDGPFLWLHVNEIIVQQSHGQKSLEDFLRLFYSDHGDHLRVSPYTAQDVLDTLQLVAPYDWRAFFTAQLDSLSSQAPLSGLQASGWKLVYTSQPNSFLAAVRPNGLGTTMNSVGFSVGNDGTVADVVRGGPADTASLTPGEKIKQVNGKAWSPAVLADSIAKGNQETGSIRVDTEIAGVTKSHTILYQGGTRNPHLERVAGIADDLTAIFQPLKQSGSKQ